MEKLKAKKTDSSKSTKAKAKSQSKYQLPEYYDIKTRVLDMVSKFRNGQLDHLLDDTGRMRTTMIRNLVLFNEIEDEMETLIECFDSFHITGSKVICITRNEQESAAEFHNRVVTVYTYLENSRKPFILLLTGYGYGNIPALRTIHESITGASPILYVAYYLSKGFSGISSFASSKQAQITANNSALIEGHSHFKEFDALLNQDNFITVTKPWQLLTVWFETCLNRLLGRPKEVCHNPKDHMIKTFSDDNNHDHVCDPAWHTKRDVEANVKAENDEKIKKSKLEQYTKDHVEKTFEKKSKNILIVNNNVNTNINGDKDGNK